MIGASRQTVSKALRHFSRAGWLRQEGRMLLLRDSAGLTEVREDPKHGGTPSEALSARLAICLIKGTDKQCKQV